MAITVFNMSTALVIIHSEVQKIAVPRVKAETRSRYCMAVYLCIDIKIQQLNLLEMF